MSFIYVTKPVQIEAVSYDVLSYMEKGITAAIPKWLLGGFIDGTLAMAGTELTCNTKNGRVAVNPGDMLIRLADGEIYPCDLQVFNSKYEKLPEAADKHPYD